MAAAASPRTRWRCSSTAEEAGVEQRIVATVVAVNDDRKAAMADRVATALGGSLEGKRIGGARADLQAQYRRHARRAVDPADRSGCCEGGAEVVGVRPGRRASRPSRCCPAIEFAADAYAAAEGADALVIVTEWDEFRALDLDRLAESMRGNGAGRPAQCLRPGRSRARRIGPFWSRTRPKRYSG